MSDASYRAYFICLPNENINPAILKHKHVAHNKTGVPLDCTTTCVKLEKLLNPYDNWNTTYPHDAIS